MSKIVESLSPIDNSVVGAFEIKDLEEVKIIVKNAAIAQPEWEALPLIERTAKLRKLADLLEEHAQEIGEILTEDMGKPIEMAKTECYDAANLLRGHCEKALHLYGEVLGQNTPNNTDLVFTRREALGVVACIIPYNFPIELTYQKVAPALVMGNTCIVKVPSFNPLAVLYTKRFFDEAGIPDGVCQIFAAEREAVNQGIIDSPDVAAVAMTGSTEAGAAMASRAVKTLKHIMMELGGNDPFVIFNDVDPKKAAEEIAAGRWENCGQICCGTKRIIIQKGIKEKVIKELIKVLEGWKVGDPMDPDTVVGYLVNEKAAITVENQVRQTVEAGGNIVWGNGRSGARWEPVILDGITPDMDIAKDMEIFASVFPFIEFETEEEAVRIANNTSYGLSAGVLSGDIQRAFRVASKIKAGGVVINGHGCCRIYEQAFGGMKMSGIGREGIICGCEEYSQVKTYYYHGAFA